MEKIISFIVPSYNCENFLDKCLSSFINEQVMDKIEVIVVNDGSTDNTVRVAREFEKKHSTVFRVISQENRGHGGAINAGTSAARGKYLKPIDADDWVLTESLPEYVRALDWLDCDVVLTHHHTIDMTIGEKLKWMTYPESFGKAYTLEEIMDSWKSFDRSLTYHGITYRTSFYKENALPLTERVFYEDHEFATIPCCLAQSVVPLDLFLYQYRIGDSSQSVSDINQLRRINHTEAVLKRLIKEQNITYDLGVQSGGKRYYEQKTQGLLLSFFTTATLVDPNKTRGRRNAKRLMNMFTKKMPGVAALAENQYRIFMALNRLHVSKKTYKKILGTTIYNKLRGNHNFS